MKKEVMLTIASVQKFEDMDEENINLVTQAMLYERGGKLYIVYDETSLTGLEGTRTMVKMDDMRISMIRTGTYSSELIFALGQRHVGLYHTDAGAVTISTHTKQLENTVSMDGGELTLEYTIEVDNSLVGNHRFHMLVTPTGAELR